MAVIPQLRLEMVPVEGTETSELKISFEPHPDNWVFDLTRGKREELRSNIAGLCQAALQQGWNEDVHTNLRAAVFFILLEWVALRGLVIPAPPCPTLEELRQVADVAFDITKGTDSRAE